MTAMLASVTGPAEAEIAIAGGADIIDLKDPAAGALSALPIAQVAQTVAVIAGRRPASAVIGDLSSAPERAIDAARQAAKTGVDYVKVGLFPHGARDKTIRALAEIAAEIRLVAVLFADRERKFAENVPELAAAGFSGVMVDTADKSGGRLLGHADIPALARFVAAARDEKLLVGLAGGLEAPDVPRLLPLEPDFLGFRGALCAAGDRKAGIELAAVQAIRRLIPPGRQRTRSANVDYRLLSARGYSPDAPDDDRQRDRVFVRDLVLPVRIGAYSHEREAPQKVRFDVEVEVAKASGTPKGMEQVFSYALITDGIAAIVAAGHIDFVETLAEEIAARTLAHPRAMRVTVRVAKLELGPGEVGVEIVKDKQPRATDANPVLAMLDRAKPPRGEC